MTPTAQTAAIIAEFDFELVHHCMVSMNWTWSKIGIPTIAQLTRGAKRLLQQMHNNPALIMCGTGGFEVTRTGKDRKGLKLAFVVTDYDTTDYQ